MDRLAGGAAARARRHAPVRVRQGRRGLRRRGRGCRASERDDPRGVGDRGADAGCRGGATRGGAACGPPAAPPRRRIRVARSRDEGLVLRETYYSVGGGFIRREGEPPRVAGARVPARLRQRRGAARRCATSAASRSPKPRASTRRRCAPTRRSPPGSTRIWDAMAACVEAGLHADGVLPGMLQVKRRASAIREQLEEAEADGRRELPGEWLGAFALAVNEENAAGRTRGHGADERGGRHPARRRDVLVAIPRRLRTRRGQRRHAVRRARRQRAAGIRRHAAARPSRRADSSTRSSSPRRTGGAASVGSCSPRPRWGRCSRRTRRSRAPRAGARPRSGRRARWPRAA